MRYAIAVAVLLAAVAPAAAQDFVSQCTLDNIGDDEVLCQHDGAWGTCQIDGGVPACGIAYCGFSALEGDSCVVAGYDGACVPLCEAQFSTSCDDDDELVCEVGAGGNFDDDTLTCATGGAGTTAPSFLLLALLLCRRRK